MLPGIREGAARKSNMGLGFADEADGGCPEKVDDGSVKPDPSNMWKVNESGRDGRLSTDP